MTMSRNLHLTAAGIFSPENLPLTDWIGARLQALPTSDIAFVLVMFVAIRASSRLGMWAYALFSLPGTIAHESAHFLVALLLGARPSFPSLIPQRTEHGWRLGSVMFRAGMVRSVPIALAPLLLAPLSLYWAASFLVAASGPWVLLHAWVVAALLSASLPSSADFKIALPALAIIGVIAAIVWALSIW